MVIRKLARWLEEQWRVSEYCQAIQEKRVLSNPEIVHSCFYDSVTNPKLKDENMENMLLLSILTFLRGGNFEKAIELTIQAKHPLRALTLQGIFDFLSTYEEIFDVASGISKGPRSFDDKESPLDDPLDATEFRDTDDDLSDDELSDPVIGTGIGGIGCSNLSAWLVAANEIVDSPATLDVERVLYAIFAGRYDILTKSDAKLTELIAKKMGGPVSFNMMWILSRCILSESIILKALNHDIERYNTLLNSSSSIPYPDHFLPERSLNEILDFVPEKYKTPLSRIHISMIKGDPDEIVEFCYKFACSPIFLSVNEAASRGKALRLPGCESHTYSTHKNRLQSGSSSKDSSRTSQSRSSAHLFSSSAISHQPSLFASSFSKGRVRNGDIASSSLAATSTEDSISLVSGDNMLRPHSHHDQLCDNPALFDPSQSHFLDMWYVFQFICSVVCGICETEDCRKKAKEYAVLLASSKQVGEEEDDLSASEESEDADGVASVSEDIPSLTNTSVSKVKEILTRWCVNYCCALRDFRFLSQSLLSFSCKSPLTCIPPELASKLMGICGGLCLADSSAGTTFNATLLHKNDSIRHCILSEVISVERLKKDNVKLQEQIRKKRKNAIDKKLRKISKSSETSFKISKDDSKAIKSKRRVTFSSDVIDTSTLLSKGSNKSALATSDLTEVYDLDAKFDNIFNLSLLLMELHSVEVNAVTKGLLGAYIATQASSEASHFAKHPFSSSNHCTKPSSHSSRSSLFGSSSSSSTLTASKKEPLSLSSLVHPATGDKQSSSISLSASDRQYITSFGLFSACLALRWWSVSCTADEMVSRLTNESNVRLYFLINLAECLKQCIWLDGSKKEINVRAAQEALKCFVLQTPPEPAHPSVDDRLIVFYVSLCRILRECVNVYSGILCHAMDWTSQKDSSIRNSAIGLGRSLGVSMDRSGAFTRSGSVGRGKRGFPQASSSSSSMNNSPALFQSSIASQSDRSKHDSALISSSGHLTKAWMTASDIFCDPSSDSQILPPVMQSSGAVLSASGRVLRGSEVPYVWSSRTMQHEMLRCIEEFDSGDAKSLVSLLRTAHLHVTSFDGWSSSDKEGSLGPKEKCCGGLCSKVSVHSIVTQVIHEALSVLHRGNMSRDKIAIAIKLTSFFNKYKRVIDNREKARKLLTEVIVCDALQGEGKKWWYASTSK
ncbi:hypothetical protein ADUPG1_013552 [Aduncisulcus paluster]|uniref:Uncharacterized protein n=1 Tax=Aduncisulcus paluster TaxID=2918883 RepID=A0ABQ5K6Y3_9EUKA|nr:hypothetical protein ADUPG1_013552 [Aduncisulcus paluster]